VLGLILGTVLAALLQAVGAQMGFRSMKWQAAVIVLAMAIFIGLVAALVPALIASRKNVVESLRFTG
jgi:ABC-type antimicrobial peptide transport system permease subunit